jgi:hypothetical protein
MRLRTKADHVTWIMKPESGCCGIGIRLIQQPLDVMNDSSPAVVQLYVTPWLVDGFKFDFRFYLLISDLHPLTLYLYQEGIARFCTKKYRYPTRQNLSEKFCHLTNISESHVQAANSQEVLFWKICPSRSGLHFSDVRGAMQDVKKKRRV